MNAMIDWIVGLRWNGMLALCLYWLPLVLCVYGYTVRTWADYQDEVDKREDCEKNGGFYYPTLTIGTIIGRAVAAVIPVANLFAAIFDVAPKVFGDFFSWVGRVFDQPLVPKRKVTK